ncbi:metal-dependent hydrolase [Massilia consociata]|uniref:Metal-dependent hydrolase n=1 Tax=Massilia consociata TaxID=760117 RepID=A0ABV6FB35_9BURK
MSSLTVRKLDVDLAQGFGRRWLGGDAYRTQFFNALSMTFPIGEQMFIDSLRAIPDALLADPVLRAEVKDFVGQEATHRYMHIQYNAELERQGLSFVTEKRILRRVRRIDGFGVRNRVAITCALEHYTAMLADGVLRHPEWIADAEPALRRLWEWHAVEELEHKAVAFDAYRAAGGGYWRRVLWFLHVSLVFWFDNFWQTAHNLHRDGALWKIGTWASAARTWFGRRGLAWHMAGPVLAYFSPSFHPWQHDNRALLKTWLDSNSDAYRAVRTTAP